MDWAHKGLLGECAQQLRRHWDLMEEDGRTHPAYKNYHHAIRVIDTPPPSQGCCKEGLGVMGWEERGLINLAQKLTTIMAQARAREARAPTPARALQEEAARAALVRPTGALKRVIQREKPQGTALKAELDSFLESKLTPSGLAVGSHANACMQQLASHPSADESRTTSHAEHTTRASPTQSPKNV